MTQEANRLNGVMKERGHRRKLVKYSIGLLVISGGLWYYNSDSNPPELSEFSFSKSLISLSDEDRSLQFSGRITDERGISLVELRCVENDETRLISYMSMSGSFRGGVSFGVAGRTAKWVSYWDGNRYDLNYDAIGALPAGMQPFQCSWFAHLADELGNEIVMDLKQTLELAS